MPDITTVFIFATASLVLTATPGPDMLLIASRTVSQGRSAGFLTFAGIAAGTYCHAIAAGLGLSKLFLTVPVIYKIVSWAGCAYLVYLAYKAIKTKASVFAPSQTDINFSGVRIFAAGLATNLLNPKMALFVLAFFPQFMDPAGGSLVIQMIQLATVLNCVGFAVNTVVILLGNQMRRHLASVRRFSSIPKYLLATVFAGLACRLALGARN